LPCLNVKRIRIKYSKIFAEFLGRDDNFYEFVIIIKIEQQNDLK